VSAQESNFADLGFRAGDHVCAFYNEGGNTGNSLDDIIVDYVSKALRAENKCVCFIDTEPAVRDRIPSELVSREGIVQFFTEDEAYLPGGQFSKDGLLHSLEALVKQALSDGYQRCWVLGNVSWVVRNAFDTKTWFAAESEVNELAPRYPQIIMCLYDLDLFDGETVMYVLKTHPRIFVNGMIIANPHYIPTRQFLGSS
jgi:MEDS: MEthanogen/methylotroph, DcmR Sensory domain